VIAVAVVISIATGCAAALLSFLTFALEPPQAAANKSDNKTVANDSN
jgi:hypothetical protein